jgi:5-methylthioadenosine/S-adenosylhomocysteine deaminase
MMTLIKNGIYFDENYQVCPINILIANGVIVRVSKTDLPKDPADQVFDLQGRLLVPGFVDSHTHLAQSFGRGIYDNLHLTQWLERRSWDHPLNKEEVYAASLLGALEALRSGTTSVAEMTTVGDLGEIVIQAIADSDP